MLTEQEEQKLNWMVEEVGTESRIDIGDIKWVVSKLKETNDECSRVTLELQEANEALARAVDTGYY